MLVEYASHHIQHMQKALTQILQHVISDITGKTGMMILVGGKESPQAGTLRETRATEATIAKSLQGQAGSTSSN